MGVIEVIAGGTILGAGDQADAAQIGCCNRAALQVGDQVASVPDVGGGRAALVILIAIDGFSYVLHLSL